MKYILSILILVAFISGACYSQTVKADFDIVLNYQCGYTTVEFENKSINADSCFWDFYGDGQFIYYSNPNPSYSNMGNLRSEGIFTFSMIAKGIGQPDTITKSMNFKPTSINFEVDLKDSLNYAPLAVKFMNTSIPQNGDILTYDWSMNTYPFSLDENSTHVFTKPGTYHIELNATTQNGCHLHHFESITVRDSAQINEFDFITAGCYSMKAPCGHEKHFDLVNDTLKMYGSYGGNCCTNKTATMKTSGDTIYVRTFETGEQCTCGCEFCFAIDVPNMTTDSVIVSFDGRISTARLLTSVTGIENEPCFEIYPNPVDHEFTLSCNQLTDQSSMEIQDLSGRVVYELSKGLSDKIIIDCNSIKPGTYILKLNVDEKNCLTKKIIIH